MKSTTSFVLFLLCAITSYLPSATAETVLDTDGDLLQNGGSYFVLPVMRGRGGGIEFVATGNETCPLTVSQSPNELCKGIPTRFSSLLRIPFINEGDLLTIQFRLIPSCADIPSLWTVVEGLPEGSAVKITGYQNTVTGKFQIQKASPKYDGYKLLFCPSPFDDITCKDIRSADGPLVLSSEDNPLLVQFQKLVPVLDEVPPLAMKNNILFASE